MSNLNIIYGAGEQTKRKLDVLLEPAVEYYGSEYESLILDLVSNTYFYEADGKYNEQDIINYLCGTKKIRTSNFNTPNQRPAFYLRQSSGKGYNNIVVTPNIETDYDYHIFAHELFGHTMFEIYDAVIEKGKQIYGRNGISLAGRKRDYYDILNEGCVESVASSIVKLNKHNIKDISSQKYMTAKYCGDKMFDVSGREMMLEILVYNRHNIEKEYNQDSKINHLKRLNSLLELELKTRPNPYINKTINQSIEKNLIGFQKRKIRN